MSQSIRETTVTRLTDDGCLIIQFGGRDVHFSADRVEGNPQDYVGKLVTVVGWGSMEDGSYSINKMKLSKDFGPGDHLAADHEVRDAEERSRKWNEDYYKKQAEKRFQHWSSVYE